MLVKSAEFIISAVKPSQYPEGARAEIALAGRSNVGKSSMINRLISRKSLARTSGTPGKTQQLNYYLINNDFYFVDLPGYGFAKVPKTVKEQWGKMIEQYLSKRENLICVLQLVDIRHEPSKEDQVMYEWLTHYDFPHAVVATKADKISKGQWLRHMNVIRKSLGMTDEVPFYAFSAEAGIGVDDIWDFLTPILEAHREETSV